MDKKVYVGIDNGSTGSIGIITPESSSMAHPPVRKQLNYHKKAENISRIDYPEFVKWLIALRDSSAINGWQLMAILEKPFTGMPNAAVLAGRVYEAEIIALEECGIPYTTICASDWQGTIKRAGMLPSGLKGSAEHKAASRDIGLRLFPDLADAIKKHRDADGLLIAEWARRQGL